LEGYDDREVVEAVLVDDAESDVHEYCLMKDMNKVGCTLARTDYTLQDAAGSMSEEDSLVGFATIGYE
jgi:hypothetical protein